MTKLDVLSQFDEIPIIVGYKKDGQFVDHFNPMDNLELCEPVLKYIPGWKEDISSCTSWEQLPENARSYILQIEELLNHEISFISVGAKREQYLLTHGAKEMFLCH